ncbi:hypothetical protein M0805_008542 [Coniferiporia weirii]|nr:hypothetical protein M0805_008542 [Coniferiporia weirii]
MVSDICGKKPSRKWLRAFKICHPELKLARSTGLDPKRAQAFNWMTVMHYFDILEKTLSDYNIPWENVYNMDEKGIQMGGGWKGCQQKFFFSKNQRVQAKMQSADLQLATVIECVCADRSTVDPGFVLEGRAGYCPEWFEDLDKYNYLVSITENGWTNNFVCTEWFEKIFIPFIKARNTGPSRPSLLLLDGHGSHLTDHMRELAISNEVHLVCLPPHTTHQLQPLDVGIFTHVQWAWEDQSDDAVDKTGQGIQAKEVIREYFKLCEGAFSPTRVISAWRRAGLNPIDRTVFANKDFAPSQDTSVLGHVPDSFPVTLPLATMTGNLTGPADDVEFERDAVESGSRSENESKSGSESESENESENESKTEESGSSSKLERHLADMESGANLVSNSEFGTNDDPKTGSGTSVTCLDSTFLSVQLSPLTMFGTTVTSTDSAHSPPQSMSLPSGSSTVSAGVRVLQKRKC